MEQPFCYCKATVQIPVNCHVRGPGLCQPQCQRATTSTAYQLWLKNEYQRLSSEQAAMEKHSGWPSSTGNGRIHRLSMLAVSQRQLLLIFKQCLSAFAHSIASHAFGSNLNLIFTSREKSTDSLPDRIRSTDVLCFVRPHRLGSDEHSTVRSTNLYIESSLIQFAILHTQTNGWKLFVTIQQLRSRKSLRQQLCSSIHIVPILKHFPFVVHSFGMESRSRESSRLTSFVARMTM